jgi:hypothetical protein
MDKELIQQVIDKLSPAHPKHESFERALRKLIAKFDTPKPTVRLYCEGQSDENIEL